MHLVGDELEVPCVDGIDRRYLSLDAAASTPALPAVAERVASFTPWYSSVHRGAGYKSQMATTAYELARESALVFAGRAGSDDIAILCRNTTEAINHLAYRLRLTETDVIITTVLEHHANLLPWSRSPAQRRYVECDVTGRFGVEDVVAAMDDGPPPRLIAITAASNVSGWIPPLEEIICEAHERGAQVLLDAAQLSAHHPLPPGADFLAWSGHKMYAPFGTGVLIGPRDAFSHGDPFLAGGGAVDLVDLDEVWWTDPPEREEAGSPNVMGAVAMHAAIDALGAIGWPAILEHEAALARSLRNGLAGIEGVNLLGPPLEQDTLAIGTFTVTGVPHALVAARLSAEFGIGVRHGCFCAHPYLIRLLGLGADEITRYREDVRRGDRTHIPGAVRASCGLSSTIEDIDRLLDAVRVIASGAPAPVEYSQDPASGDFWPEGGASPWSTGDRSLGSSCSRG